MKRIVLFCLIIFLIPINASAGELQGFIEGAGGARFESDTTKKDGYNLLETRLQLKYSYLPSSKYLADRNTEFFLKAEAIADGYKEEVTLIIREANLLFTPASFIDLKIGRQILTWGTGDYLFINDLFPKDYVSFFIGRDDEYLKVPSDAVRASFFTEFANINLVVIPFFEPDNTINGHRLSFFDSFEGRVVGRESDRTISERTDSFKNTETALRVYRNFGSFEGAVYGFRGFYKQPRGVKDEQIKEVYYPELNVYGASIRGPVFGGIGNMEIGYYDSREDKNGTNRLIENSSTKYLIGYERDFGNDFKGGWQYFLEQIMDYDEYKASLQSGEIKRDEFRHLLTMRLTKLFKQQTVETSLFVFYSPSDRDFYLRPKVLYDVTDKWKFIIGANIFGGKDNYTEFGQLEKNDNIYARVRYNF